MNQQQVRPDMTHAEAVDLSLQGIVLAWTPSRGWHEATAANAATPSSRKVGGDHDV